MTTQEMTASGRQLGASVRSWWGVAAAMFTIAWGGNEFTPLLVMYKNNGLSVTTVNFLLFAYVLGIVPALLIGGPLSDRFGRAPLLRPAPLISASGSLLIAFGSSTVAVMWVGRVLCGIALGLAMAVGSSWLKELSAGKPTGTGARRSAMSLTGGFAIGAGCAGVLAQWAPLPDTLPFLISAVLCLIATAWVLRAPETLGRNRNPGRLIDDIKVPAAAHRRFLRIALPIALWLFSSAATAYAIMPTLMAGKVHSAPIAFSALVGVLTLGCGFAIQSVARRIDRPGTARTAAVSLTLTTTGMIVAAWSSAALTLSTTLATALLLGAGYGIGLVAGLQEIERIALPTDLAGLTAVFYSVSYLGFGAPMLLSFLHQATGASYPTMFGIGAALAASCLAVVLGDYRVRGTRTRRDAELEPVAASR